MANTGKQAVSKVIALDELRLQLWLHTARDPSAEEWETGVADLRALRDERPDLSHLRMLVLTDGGRPNAKQRRDLLTDTHGNRPVKTAGIAMGLTNPVLLGVATAMSWLNPEFKLYSPHQAAAALAYLDVTRHTERVVAELRALGEALPNVEALRLAIEHLGPGRE